MLQHSSKSAPTNNRDLLVPQLPCALASAAALRQIIDNFVNQETQQRPERFVTLFSSSVRRSIKGVCAFTLRHNRLEAALHGTGGQTIWVFHCNWCHRPLVHLNSYWGSLMSL